MKKLLVGLLTTFTLVGCGTDSNTGTGDTTYNVDVSNVGDGDIVVNTGSGVVTIGRDDECIFAVDENTTRSCTQSEFDNAYADSATVK